MSGLYNMIFGDGRPGLYLVQELGIDPGRYRDAWIERDGEGGYRIAVYTRNGGGNREEYAGINARMGTHELYLFDQDDYFDSTYATFYFSVPESVVQFLDHQVPKWRDEVQDPVDTSKKWLDAIAALEKGTKG